MVLIVCRLVAYLVALHVLLAYGLVVYAIYAHLRQSWLGDDPRMIIPGAALIALAFGGVLALVLTASRRRLRRLEVLVLAAVAVMGLLLLPAVYASAFVFDW
jgi:hypothetical protein